VARRLVEAQAGLESKDAKGRTPLHLVVVAAAAAPALPAGASRPSSAAIIRGGCPAGVPLATLGLLLGAGANSLATDAEGLTPLQLAEGLGWPEGADALRPVEEAQRADVEAAAAEAARSGDGTIVNVGIKVAAVIPCQHCNQRFDSDSARDVHWRFIHDPNRHLDD